MRLLNFIIEERNWVNRNNVIDIIQQINNKNFDEIVLSFAKQASEQSNPSFLEVSLLLSSVLPSEDNIDAVLNTVIPFFLQILQMGLSSEISELRLAALQFIVNSQPLKRINFIGEHPDCWIRCVELFDKLIQLDPTFTNQAIQIEFKRMLSLFNSALSEPFPVNPIPLLERCLAFYSNIPNYTNIQDIHNLIFIISSNYPEPVITSGMFIQIIRLFAIASAQYFVPDDSFSMSNAQFFEPTFSAICQSAELCQCLWEFTTSNIGSDVGKFVFLRSCAATFSGSPDFYKSHFSDISAMLCQSISSDCFLLVDAAARTAYDFVTFFTDQADELSQGLIVPFLSIAQHRPSAELLQVLSILLDVSAKTESLFETAYPIFMAELTGGSPDVQAAALPCLSSLLKWSTVKITVYHVPLFETLLSLLNSQTEHLVGLKAPAVDCISQVVKVISAANFQRWIVPFCHFFVNNLNDEDAGLSVACLKALDSVCVTFPTIFSPILPHILEALISRATKDVSQEIDPEDENPLIYEAPANALRTLADITFMNSTKGELLGQIMTVVIQCCMQFRESPSSQCRMAAAYSISRLASACSSKFPEMTQQTPNSPLAIVPEVLFPMLDIDGDMDVNIEVFNSIKIVIQFLAVDFFSKEQQQMIVQIMSQFLQSSDVQEWRPKHPHMDIYESIVELIMNICETGSWIGVQAIAPLTPIFEEFASRGELRFKAFACRFFSAIVCFSQRDQPEFSKYVEFAVSIASSDLHYAPFMFFRDVMFRKNVKLLSPFLPQIEQILIDRLKMPVINTEMFLMMHDNCLAAYALYMQKMGLVDDEHAMVALNAMPCLRDNGQMLEVARFLLWLWQQTKGKFPGEFAQVLATIFSCPIDLVNSLYRNNLVVKNMQKLFTAIVNSAENVNEALAQLVDGDNDRITNLQAALILPQ